MRLTPLLRITLALISLTATLFVLADLFFKVLPDRVTQTMQVRTRVGEALAAQVAALLPRHDRESLEASLTAILEHTEELASIGVRRTDGAVVLRAGDHERKWHSPLGGRSTLDQVVVPLHVGDQQWGQLELRFRPDERAFVRRWLAEPLVVTLLFISIAGALMYWLYLRRALQHLDPASVIPERVQSAFDAMAEGVVVLDARGRILLANNVFRGLHGDAPEPLIGATLSMLSWLEAELPRDADEHPWMKAIRDHTSHTGFTLDIGANVEAGRKMVVNCAPILDARGGARGCLTTFDDVTALHRSNERLRELLVELAESKNETKKKNEELERLATRDPLTGTLNRRVFYEVADKLFVQACEKGTELSCILVDIDQFKSINDRFGHSIGDRVIQEVARRMQVCVRTMDLVFRYGGEEFCIVLPGAELETALEIAERMRGSIESDCGPGIREVLGLQVTASFGVASLESRPANLSQMVDWADQALYQAKHAGRNRVLPWVRTSLGAKPPAIEKQMLVAAEPR